MRHVFPGPDHIADVDRIGGPVVIAAAGRHQESETARHSHSRGQLVVAMGGLTTVGIDSRIWVVPAGHSAWLPPYCPHWVRSHGHAGRSGVYIDVIACATLSPYPGVIETSALLREAVLRTAEWRDCDDPRHPEHMHVAALLIYEIQVQALPVQTFTLPLPREARLRPVAQALIDNPADRRDLDSWARVAGTSSRTLSRNFTVYTGFDFAAWRQRARLLRSLEMLTTDLPISVIALELGYATASAFISVFRRTFGETPADHRRRLLIGPL